MAVNKVVMNTPNGEQTLIDLTGDTVTPEALAKGAIAHNASGEVVTGTMPTTTVLYTPQTLTDAQKEQARQNIGAQNALITTPQMFGAKGDGVTDDTAAIQAAINGASEIFIPEGTYKISSTISVPKNKRITGTIGTVITGNSSINGLTISGDNIRVDKLTIKNCNYAIYLSAYNCVFRDLLLRDSAVGCFFNTTGTYANYFYDCSFKYNNIGLEGRMIFTSVFYNIQVYKNTTFGIKANFRAVSFYSGYIEENGVEIVDGERIAVAGTAGIYMPNDTSYYGTGQLIFNGVDFENNGEAAIRHDNQSGAMDVVFLGGNIQGCKNPKAIIWLNVFGKVQRWFFVGTKIAESEELAKIQVVGHPEGTWSDVNKKPTQFYSNRRFNSDCPIIQYATIDGTIANSFFVTDAEKTAWNAKSNFSGSYSDLTNVPTNLVTTEDLNRAITGAIEGGY